jgi:hypothetical protein
MIETLAFRWPSTACCCEAADASMKRTTGDCPGQRALDRQRHVIARIEPVGPPRALPRTVRNERPPTAIGPQLAPAVRRMYSARSQAGRE